jgi:DNA-binding NarL/FixJ family response regulator
VSGERLRLVVADDQTSVRDGLVALLSTLPDLEVVGAAADGAAALDLVERERPDAVLMDLRMPGVDGVRATEQITREHPGVAVVVLTTYADHETVLAAMGAGAAGYLTKDAGRADMARALHAAVAGQVTLAGPVRATLLSAALRGRAAEPWPDGLTDREGEILVLIANGLSNQEITARLFIGTATVKTHINRIFAKIGVRDRRGAIEYAVSRRLSTRGSPGAGPAM